jgi:hypothetical protein
MANLPDFEQVGEILSACETALADPGSIDLRQLGYWRAVAALKRHPEWLAAYGGRVSDIDRRAFEATTWPVLPVESGARLLGGVTLTGAVLLALVPAAPRWLRGWLTLLGTGAIIWSSHSLTHFVVGWLQGIRFQGWYLDGPTKLQPGLKVEYASYLATAPASRAWFHASGAIESKLVPFLSFLLTLRSPMALGFRLALLAIGFGSIATDALFSVDHADWKKFRRERALARRAGNA